MAMHVEEVKPIETRKKVLAGVMVLLAVAALAWGGYKFWLAFSDPAMPQTVDDVEDLMNDPRYAAMSRDEREPYQEHMNEMFGGLSEADRQRLGELVMSNDTAMREMIDQGMDFMRGIHRPLADAETEQQRDAILDGMIAMMAGMEARNNGQARPSGDEMSEEQQSQMERGMNMAMDSGDPQGIGYMSELFKLLNNRRQERGMSPMGE
ncbi:hypothetical protein OT109_17025 [Phycisphaeraceae bacterium D3-23]